ncbi:MAG: choice-of-anchor U domain-containing protein, partial [bacterium]
DITSIYHLTKLTVPHLVLEDETAYIARVKFFDDSLNASEWSDPIEFTTLTNQNDLNENGVPDDQEVGGPTDMNKDSITDYGQSEITKSIQTVDGNVIITVSKDSDSVLAIEALETTDPSAISEMNRKPKKIMLGLVAYRIRVDTFGASASMRIGFSENISMAKYFYKYDTIHGWEDYSQYVYFDYPDKSIIIGLLDGGHGDSDGVANGIIIDPGGLVPSVNLSPIAIARAEQSVNEGEMGTLDATGSMDPDGKIMSYSWSQIGGTIVTLFDASAVQTSFTAPSFDAKGVEPITFQLEVTDDDGLVDTDTVIIYMSENSGMNTPSVLQNTPGGCFVSVLEISN